MEQADSSTQALRDRLAGLLADWGTEFSCLLDELDQAKARIVDLTDQVSARDSELQQRADELQDRDSLIRQLREERDAERRARVEDDRRIAELEQFRVRHREDQQQIEALRSELATLRDTADESSSHEAEVEALRAELDARRTLIRSLRADAQRASVLEARLEEKAGVIEQLEQSVNRHAATILELKRNAEHWKSRFRALQVDTGATTTVTAGTASRVDATVAEDVAGASAANTPAAPAEETGDQTIAIDMRQALLEARRAAGAGRVKS